MPNRDTDIVRKQSNVQLVIKQGYPTGGDAKEGTLTVRNIPGTGLCIFVFYANRWKMVKLNDLNSKDETILENLIVNNITINNDFIIKSKKRRLLPVTSGNVGRTRNLRNPNENKSKGEIAHRNLRSGTFNPDFGDILTLNSITLRDDDGTLKFRNVNDSDDADIIGKSLTLPSSDGTVVTIKNDSGNFITTMDEDSGAKTFKINRDLLNGNPAIQVGSSDNDCLTISTIYDSGAKGMDYAVIGTTAASGDPNKGIIKFKVDGDNEKLQLDDAGVDITGTLNTTGIVGITTTTANQLKIAYDATNYTAFTVIDNGYLTISNIDGGAAAKTLTFSGAKLEFDGANHRYIAMDDVASGGDANRLYLSGSDAAAGTTDKDGGDTYIQGGKCTGAGDGGDIIFQVTKPGSTGTAKQSWSTRFYISGVNGHNIFKNDVEFDIGSVGFDKDTTTFAAAAVTSEGDDSTDIDFRGGNKHELTLTNNIAGSGEHINMIFTATSGNFLLTVVQDGTGSRTVHSDGWKAYDYEENECANELGANGTDGEVRWAGGTAPTLTTTANKTDIVSIYWDADNETACCTITHNF